PSLSSSSFRKTISTLYSPIKHNLSTQHYVDAYGNDFALDGIEWDKPLGRDVLILDMDTRSPDGENEVFGPKKLNWETATGQEGDGMLSASFMNHFLYAQIHGYDYKFFKSQPLKGMHDTWIKPVVLERFLDSYRFIVFIDADATIQHLEVPLEWLFSLWKIGPNTSAAMPIDTEQDINGNPNTSRDSKGRVTLNTGFVVMQNLPTTFEMLRAWRECPTEKQYEGCGFWKENWSHEQRAFSEYIRYDFNATGKEIVEIPCDHAMGYPDLKKNNPHITSDCRGQFVRHHTVDKAMTKTSTDLAMLQTLTQLIQLTLKNHQADVMIEEKYCGILKTFWPGSC
ncbi:hypothetical protein DM02DRAFT_699918, partial [Periconia macrospinosa]